MQREQHDHARRVRRGEQPHGERQLATRERRREQPRQQQVHEQRADAEDEAAGQQPAVPGRGREHHGPGQHHREAGQAGGPRRPAVERGAERQRQRDRRHGDRPHEEADREVGEGELGAQRVRREAEPRRTSSRPRRSSPSRWPAAASGSAPAPAIRVHPAILVPGGRSPRRSAVLMHVGGPPSGLRIRRRPRTLEAHMDRNGSLLAVGAALLALAAHPSAAAETAAEPQGPEQFTGVLANTVNGGTIPIVVHIDSYSPAGDVRALALLLKDKGQDAVETALFRMKGRGWIRIGIEPRVRGPAHPLAADPDRPPHRRHRRPADPVLGAVAGHAVAAVPVRDGRPRPRPHRPRRRAA